jgi:putative DNA primase/helicase
MLTAHRTPPEWTKPRSLDGPAHQLENLTPEHFPQTCRPFLADIALRLQCPLEYAAAPFIVAFSSLVGRRVALRLHQHDDWLVVPNLWGAVVGQPGTMKSAASARALAPLIDLENEAFTTFRQELSRFNMRRRMSRYEGRPLESPVCRRFTVGDASLEKLALLLKRNPNGLLFYRDDLAAWLHSIGGAKQRRARELFLQAAGGDGPLIVDRLTRNALRLSAVCLSVCGGLDPASLNSLLAHSKSRSDLAALFQRIQILFWPDVAAQWQFADPPPADQSEYTLRELFRNFAQGHAVPANLPRHEKTNVPFVWLTPAAQDLYRAWRERLETALRVPKSPSAQRAHLARYRSLVPSMALLLRILDRGVGDVDQPDFELALRWEQVLLSHARRVYHSVATDSAAQVLLDRLLDHRIHWDSFGWEDLRRCQWSGLQRPGDLTRAIITLLDTGHIRVAHATPSGRPLRYQLNPLAETSSV